MFQNLSIPVLVLIVLVILALFVAVKSLSMPQSFFKNQEKKEELKKILEKNKEYRETAS